MIKYLYATLAFTLYFLWMTLSLLILKFFMWLFLPIILWIAFHAGKMDVRRERQMEKNK